MMGCKVERLVEFGNKDHAQKCWTVDFLPEILQGKFKNDGMSGQVFITFTHCMVPKPNKSKK